MAEHKYIYLIVVVNHNPELYGNVYLFGLTVKTTLLETKLKTQTKIFDLSFIDPILSLFIRGGYGADNPDF